NYDLSTGVFWRCIEEKLVITGSGKDESGEHEAAVRLYFGMLMREEAQIFAEDNQMHPALVHEVKRADLLKLAFARRTAVLPRRFAIRPDRCFQCCRFTRFDSARFGLELNLERLWSGFLTWALISDFEGEHKSKWLIGRRAYPQS